MPKISKKSLLVLGAGRLNIPALREMSKVVSVVALDKNPHSLINESQLKICECDFSDQDKLLNDLRTRMIEQWQKFSEVDYTGKNPVDIL